MSDAAHPVSFERLLAHRDWVRAVARSIALDGATADDLEQETWLEALRAPPRDDRNLRGWLGTVLRNRARKRGRSGARRAAHEAAAPVPGPVQAPADLVAEAEAQQRIVAAVLALEEPYRTTVLLRFYESLPPREVAARMGVPAETVRTRVRRAALRLREALGGDGTDLSSWMTAVAPLLVAPAPSTGATGAVAAGAVAVQTKKTILLATLAALLVGGACGYVLSLTGAAPAPRTVAALDAGDAAAPEPPAAMPEPPPERVRVTPPPRRTAPRAEADAPPLATPPEGPEPVDVTPPPPLPVAAPATDEEPVPPIVEPERNARIRAKYRDEKGGFPFYDLVYWVDAEKLEDSRWSMEALRDPDHRRGVQLIADWVNEASAVAGMTIKVVCTKLPHFDRRGGTPAVVSMPFDNLGESIPCSDVDRLIEGFYEDWKRGAKDVLEDRCEAPRKSKHKIPRLQAAAVATDPATEQRVRVEWYAWTNAKEQATYVVVVTYGTALWDKEGLVEKGGELVRNLKEIKEKVKWDDDDE